MEKDFYARYFEVEGRHWWSVGRQRIFERLLQREFRAYAGSPQLLDFGCGTGAFLPVMKKIGEVSGVDADPDAVSFCHQRGLTEVRHVTAGERLPFDEGTFDAVTALDVVEHIEDHVAALSEIHRVLRPGGVALVAVPAFMFLWGDQDEVSHHFRRYRAPGLRRVLLEAGFRVDADSYLNTFLFPPIAAVRLLRRAIRSPSAERTDFDIGPAWINDPLTRVLSSEAELLVRTRLPFGVSLMALGRKP